MDGYGVDPAALKATEHGIDSAMQELKSIGFSGGQAETGNGFDNVALSSLKVGNAALNSAFDAFCERWSWGVRTLMQDGSEFAVRLGLAAGYYHEVNNYGVGLLKDVTNDLVGNPHLSDEQAAKQSFQSTISAALHPDFSRASVENAGHHMGATWKNEGRSLMDGPNGWGKDLIGATGHGKDYEQIKDQMFGPQQQGGQG